MGGETSATAATVLFAIICVVSANNCKYVSMDALEQRCLVSVELEAPQLIPSVERSIPLTHDLERVVDQEQRHRHHATPHKHLNQRKGIEARLEETDQIIPQIDPKSVKFTVQGPWKGRFEPVKIFRGILKTENIEVFVLQGPRPLVENEIRKVQHLRSQFIFNRAISCAPFFPQVYGVWADGEVFHAVMEWGIGDLDNSFPKFIAKHLESYSSVITPPYLPIMDSDFNLVQACDSEYSTDKAAGVDFFGAHARQLIGLEAMTQMTMAVTCVHEAGLVLNNIKLDKFVIRGDNTIFLFNLMSIGMGSLGDSSIVSASVESDYRKIKFGGDIELLHEAFSTVAKHVTSSLKWRWNELDGLRCFERPLTYHLLKRIELAYLKTFEHGLSVLKAKKQNFDAKNAINLSSYTSDCVSLLSNIREAMFAKLREFERNYHRDIAPNMSYYEHDAQGVIINAPKIPKMGDLIALLQETHLP